MSMIDEWTAWLVTDAPRRLTPTTIDDYRRQLERFVAWLVTTLGLSGTPSQITAYRMERYLAELEGQVQQRQRKPATYNKAVTALTSFGAWLVVTDQRAENPARRLHTLPETPGPIRSLDRTTVVRVLDAAHHTGDLQDALVLEILAHAGLRAHEVASIQLEDLETGLRTTWVRVHGKGAKQRRVPVPKAVGGLIQEYLFQRTRKEGQRPTSGPLLVGERGGLTHTTINRIVTRVAARAQLTESERRQVTPHAFRHTVATRVVRQRDLVTAADLLGHRSLTTTRRYVKASMSELEAAVETLYDGSVLPE